MVTKKCSKCGIEKPATLEYFYAKKTNADGLFGVCKECYKKQQSEYTQINKEKIYKRHKKYYRENKEKCRAMTKEWNKSNKERVLKKAREWDARHPGYRAIRIKKWTKANPEKANQNTQRRIARIKNAICTYTIKDWEDCKEYFNNECAYCGGKVKLSQDHIIPTARGGSYTRQNIVPACKRCNSSKNTKDMNEWYKSKPYFNIKRYNKILKWANMNSNIQQLSIL